MADPTDLIAQALRARATEILIVPEKDGTRIRFVKSSGVQDRMRIPEKDGQKMVDRLKLLCHMPIGRDRELKGGTTVFANGARVRIKVQTSPYRGDLERAVIRLLKTTN